MTAPVLGLTVGARPRHGTNRVLGAGTAYVAAVHRAGGLAFLLPPGDPDTAAQVVTRLDALVLTGGTDVNPALYGEQRRHETVESPDDARDAFEVSLLKAAVQRGVPVLGICRGQQLINVALGGSLYQDIAADGLSTRWHPRRPGRRGDYLAHEIHIEPGTFLADTTATPTVMVNSMHHQAVRAVAPGLVVTALSPDGVVEGIESDDRRVVAVQSHPEELIDEPWAIAMFGRFVAAVA